MVITKTSAASAVLAVALLTTGCGTSSAPPAPTSTAAPTTSSSSPRGTTAAKTSTTASATSTEGRPTAKPAKGTGTPRGPLPKTDSVNDRNAAAVAAAYVQTVETIDTRIDNSRSDAQRRAAHWLTPDLAKEVAKGLPGGAGWAALAKKSAWTKATVTDVTPSGADPTKGLTADRVVQVEVTTYGRSRKPIGKPTTSTMTVALQRTTESKPWRVTDMQTY